MVKLTGKKRRALFSISNLYKLERPSIWAYGMISIGLLGIFNKVRWMHFERSGKVFSLELSRYSLFNIFSPSKDIYTSLRLFLDRSKVVRFFKRPIVGNGMIIELQSKKRIFKFSYWNLYKERLGKRDRSVL